MDFILSYITRFFLVLKFSDLIDIAILAVLIYQIAKIIRETRAIQLLKGILILLGVLLLSDLLNLNALNYILENTVQAGLFAIVVIFQPELRSMLERMGRSKAGKIFDVVAGQSSNDKTTEVIDELCEAAVNLSRTKTGALIVIERSTRLGDVIRTGSVVNADVSAALLENIFAPNTPLHDGAVIVRGDRIHTAGSLLPLTSNPNLSRELGTRHRAALGISEASDAMVVIVSEETGKISIAINGTLTRNLDKESLKRALERVFTTKNDADAEKFKFWRGVENA
ncbi:MAG: diadenylate cyclase CdaA [Eubacteriales bacterium]|nr:diadenylate cyclase CdaA [Eubacteriales bacterium]